MGVLVGYTHTVRDGRRVNLGYSPDPASLRAYRRLYSRSPHGWVRALEERPGELIYRLAFNAASESLGFGEARLLAPFLVAVAQKAASLAFRGRGGDPRGLAAACLYYAEVWARSRTGLEPRFSLKDAWRFAGSSRASTYRALQSLSRLLGHGDLFYRLMLRGALRGTRVARGPGRVYFPGSSLLVYRPDGGARVVWERVVQVGRVVWVPRGCLVEAYRLPRRYLGVVGSVVVVLEMRFRFRVLDLVDALSRRFGSGVFTARDAAEMLFTDPLYAGKLLGLLVERGYVEVVSRKPVARYRVVWPRGSAGGR